MPLFFFLGGLTFSSRRAFPDFLRTKAKTLLVPYYIFSLYFLAKPIAALIAPNIVSSMQANQDYGSNIGMQFYNILVNGSGLWFLWAYFIGELIVYPLDRLLRAKYQYVILGLLLIAASLTFSACLPHITIPFRIISGVEVAGFILLGIACKQLLLEIQRMPALTAFLLTAAAFVALAMLGYSTTSAVWQHTCNIGAMFLGVAASIFLSIAILHCKVLEHIGRYSLSFYAINALTLNIGKIVFFKVLHINGPHAPIAMQWVYGILLTVFCLALLWFGDLLIRWAIPWSVGVKRRKKLSKEADAI